MKKIFKTACIVFVGAAVVAAAIFLMYKLASRQKSLQAVAFVSSYENVTDEDRLTQEAYATLMNAVFEKMKKTDAPDVNKEKPDVSFVCHDGNGGDIKSYRVFRISARNRDYVIYSADEDTFYKVDTDTLDTFFDMPPIIEACLDSEIPRLILKTTVSEGTRTLGTATDGTWNYANETGDFTNIAVPNTSAGDVVELDFGLYDFCFICTKTPNKLTVYAKDEESGEQTEKEISIGEKLPALEKGKTYMLTVKAEWTETENRDYFGTVSYVFKVKTTE